MGAEFAGRFDLARQAEACPPCGVRGAHPAPPPKGSPMASSFWQGKVALVTGGSSGLGRAVAEALAAAGARVVIAARGADALAKVAAQIERRGGVCLPVVADITRADDVERLFAETLARYGQLDLLVNAAGRSRRGALADTSAEEVREMLELNVVALVRCTRAALPFLLPRRGHVVHIGSLAGKGVGRWLGAYPASKHAVTAYAQQLRLELGPEGLHVLLVCPGPIARSEPRGENTQRASDAELARLPAEARQPGGGVRTRAIDPAWLAARILRACERRQAELVVPWVARLVFALGELSPGLADCLMRWTTSGRRADGPPPALPAAQEKPRPE